MIAIRMDSAGGTEDIDHSSFLRIDACERIKERGENANRWEPVTARGLTWAARFDTATDALRFAMGYASKLRTYDLSREDGRRREPEFRFELVEIDVDGNVTML